MNLPKNKIRETGDGRFFINLGAFPERLCGQGLTRLQAMQSIEVFPNINNKRRNFPIYTNVFE